MRLQQALSTGHETDRRAALLTLQESLQPDLIILSDKSGLASFPHQSPISPDAAQQMKVF